LNRDIAYGQIGRRRIGDQGREPVERRPKFGGLSISVAQSRQMMTDQRMCHFHDVGQTWFSGED
jgi:hypothetical protein